MWFIKNFIYHLLSSVAGNNTIIIGDKIVLVMLNLTIDMCNLLQNSKNDDIILDCVSMCGAVEMSVYPSER